MVPNQEFPLILSKNVLCWPQLVHVLPNEFGYYHILLYLFQVDGGGLDFLSVVVRRYSPASRHWSFARIIIFHVSPHGDSLVHSYKVVNIGRSNSFWYFIMYTGYRFPLLSSHVDTDGSGEVPGSGSRIDSLVDFLLEVTGSWVGYNDGGFLG